MVWKYHLPGHDIDEDLCCCIPSDECRPYLPCCLRDFVAQFSALVAEQDAEFPDDPDAGPLSLARVKRWTIKNLCNSQESVDWSTWNDINSGTGGEVLLTFSGATFQGCTFGIDVSLEDLFCSCGDAGEPNFRWTATICNPQDVAIWVTIRRPNLCLSFAGVVFGSACCLDQIGLQNIGPVLIEPGEDFEFSVEFKAADWRCVNVCYKGGPPAILEGALFLDDGFDHTCLRPISCVGEINPAVFQGSAIPNCNHSLCPPCGCVSDLDCELSECCSCGCDGVEAMNSCAPPKEQCSSCTPDSGSITICESILQGFGVGEILMRCVNSDCKVTAVLGRVLGTPNWYYTRFGSPGANVSALNVPNAHCEDFDVVWSIAGGMVTLTVNGVSGSNTLPAGYDPLLPAGDCWVLAAAGARFTLK